MFPPVSNIQAKPTPILWESAPAGGESEILGSADAPILDSAEAPVIE